MLASNFFFWDWSGAPVFVPPPAPPQSTRGIGHSQNDTTYTPYTEEEWLAREAQMRAKLPPEQTPETILDKRMKYAQSVRQYQQRQQQLDVMRSQLAAAIQQLRTATNPAELTQLADTVKQLRIATGTIDNAHRAHLIQLKSQRFQLLN